MSTAPEAADAERRRWSQDSSDDAAWDARGVVDRLRKEGFPNEAVDFGDEALARWPQFQPLRSAVARALYRKDVSSLGDEPDAAAREAAKAAVTRITSLESATPYGKFSVWPQAVLQLAKSAQVRWPRAALVLLQQLDPMQLSAESSDEFPSPRARWYLGVSKAHDALEHWSELSAVCDEALHEPGLRAVDLRWVRRRKALALENTGDPDASAAILLELQGEMREWWIEADLGRVLAAAGRREEAVFACRRALANPGDLSMKWRTVFLLGQLLEPAERKVASAHYQCARHLRVREGWPPDKELEAAARRVGVTGDAPAELDIAPLRLSRRDVPDPSREAGVVKTVLDGGRSGFLVPDMGGGDLYFAMPRDSVAAAPPAGTRVTYRVTNSFDKKKNRPSKRAADLREA